jgi:hypothetical protein
MVPPQLDVGVWPPGQVRHFVQGRAVGPDWNHRAGGEVGRDTDHRRGVDSGVGDRRRNGVAQHVPVIVGHLQCPFAGKADASVTRRVLGQLVGDNRVGVGEDAAAELLAVPDPDDDGPS